MAVERNQAIAFVLVLVHFLIGSKMVRNYSANSSIGVCLTRKSFCLVKKNK